MTLAAEAVAILATADPAAKAMASRALAARWRAGGLTLGAAAPPLRPARPARPPLRPPKEMPKRRAFGAAGGRVALLHALAHIELNAIDLGWDIIVRFAGTAAPQALPDDWVAGWVDDWVGVAAEEALHFELLVQRLADLGARYGDLCAHDGLWEAATATAPDVLARLAVVPLVLEARGLDVTPAMTRRLEAAGDAESAAILDRICADEIRHVAVGQVWFDRLCRSRGLVPEAVFHDRVRRFFRGALKRPFNRAARDKAGLPAGYYEPLAAEAAGVGAGARASG